MLRRKKPPAERDQLAGIDPALVPPRWAAAVAEALDARRRWADLVAGIRPGPVRERLAVLGARIDEGVMALWESVLRAVEVQRIAEGLDVQRVTEDYKRAKRDPGADPALVEALATRFAAVQRLLNAVDDTDHRVRLLDAVSAPVSELGALRDSLAELA